jgi:nuclear transport factor 2 (NTF2) superfamily protein
VHPLVPPFTLETAAAKVQTAEDAWNTRDPARVALAYKPSAWSFSKKQHRGSASKPSSTA